MTEGGEAEASTRRWWWWGRGGVFGWLRGGGWRGRGGWVGSPGEGTRILFDDFCLQVARVATTVDNSLEDISPKQFAEYPGTWSCQKELPPVVYQGSPNSWPIGQYIAFFTSYEINNGIKLLASLVLRFLLGFHVVFKGPVAWTGKRPETGPNRTDLDRTAVAVAPPFRMDEPPRDTPSKYLQNAPKNIENDQDLNKLLNFYWRLRDTPHKYL